MQHIALQLVNWEGDFGQQNSCNKPATMFSRHKTNKKYVGISSLKTNTVGPQLKLH